MELYYFTRSGRSEDIANQLAEKHSLTTHQITDDENWQGAFNFVKGGAYSCLKRESRAQYTPVSQDVPILLIFPVWAGGFPPAVRSFLQGIDRAQVIAIPTSLGSQLKDRDGFKAVIDLVGKEIFPPDITAYL